MRALLLAIVAVVALLAPTASACSIAGPVPTPGAFTIETNEGTRVDVPVEGRLLGAMCELSNKHDLAGDLFAWAEVERYATGYPWDVHVLDLASGEETILTDVARTSIDGIGVYDRTVLAYWRDWTVMDGTSTLVAIDLDTLARRVVPLPAAKYVSASVDGHVLVAIAREPNGTERLVVYDDKARAVVAERDLEEPRWLRGVSASWILLDAPPRSANRGLLAQRIADGWTTPIDPPAPGQLIDIDGDSAYFASGEGLHRAFLTTGEVERVGENNWTLLSVHDGVRVYGRFSAPELNPLGELWWIAQPNPLQLMLFGGCVALAGIGGAGAWWWKRRSK